MYGRWTLFPASCCSIWWQPKFPKDPRDLYDRADIWHTDVQTGTAAPRADMLTILQGRAYFKSAITSSSAAAEPQRAAAYCRKRATVRVYQGLAASPCNCWLRAEWPCWLAGLTPIS